MENKYKNRKTQTTAIERRQSVLAFIGAMILTMQMTERLLNFVSIFVIQDKDGIDYKKILELEEKNKKKTIGSFLAILRSRCEFDRGFESVLAEFLEKRNELIHRFEENHGVLQSEDQILRANKFLFELDKLNCSVQKFLIGIIVSWFRQTGLSFPDFPDQLFGNLAAEFAEAAISKIK